MPPASVDAPASSKSWLIRNGYSTADAVAVVAALLLAIAFSTVFLVPSWTPRMAVLLMTLPYTTVLLVRQALRREPLALAAWGFVGAATLSAAFSGEFRLGILGVVGSETGVVVFLSSLGLMAVGTELSERGQRALVWAVIAGVALSGAVGLLQMLVQAESGPFVVRNGRASGLTPSSVYFGACAAGAFGVIVGRRSTNRRTIPVDVLLSVWFGLSIGLSGTRVALGGAVIVGTLAVVMRRELRSACSMTGLLGGTLLGRLVAAQVSPNTGVADRLRLNGGGRTEVWRYAFDSFLDRPLVGAGPGNFREAIQDDLTISFVERGRSNINSVWFNAHNFVLDSAATLGLLGLVAIAVLAVLLLRNARGPLAYGGLALVLSWTLQPFSLSTMPLALLLLGGACATRRRTRTDEHGDEHVGESIDAADARPVFAAGGVSPYLILPGLLLGGFLLVVDLSVQRSIDDRDADAAAAWVERLPPDPFLADVIGQLYVLSWVDDPDAAIDAIDWGQRAIAEQPNRAIWYVRHGTRLARFGDLEASLEAMESASAIERYSYEALEAQFYLLQALDREEDAENLRPLVCSLGAIECDSAVPESDVVVPAEDD